MLSNIIEVGDKIHIMRHIRSEHSVNCEKTYVSSLLDFINEETIKIGMPFEQTNLVLIHPGEAIKLLFYSKRGKYQCESKVLEYSKEKNLYILVVKITSELERFQRREYYRMDCLLDINYEQYVEDDEKTDTMFCGVMTDISGGGARFNSDHLHQSGEMLLLHIGFDMQEGFQRLDIIGTVISSSPIANRENQYENRVVFLDISVKERELIVKYVFEEERMIRRKEKGLM